MQVLAGEGVQRRERFVEEEHARVRHEGAGDGDALLLPAREFPRPAARMFCKPYHVQGMGDACLALRPGQVAEAEADIVGDIEPGQQARFLENEPDARMRLRDPLAVEDDAASLARSSPATSRSKVVLPQPEPPMSATISPWGTARSMRSSARVPSE